MNTHLNLNYLVVIFFICYSSCVRKENNNLRIDTNNDNLSIQNSRKIYIDTTININESISLVLTKDDKNGEIRYSNPVIQSKNKRQYINLLFNTSKLEFDFHISTNQKFLVMCYIAENGFVYQGEFDSIYNETFKCSMIELNTGKIIKDELSPKESTGVWSDDNKWVETPTGNILLTP